MSRRDTEAIGGGPVSAANDDPDSTGTQYLQQARLWFDSMWTSVRREFIP
ncbi:MAG: hypothetical protein ACRDTA_24405 [Pseudonocardiaceae bacterium]